MVRCLLELKCNRFDLLLVYSFSILGCIAIGCDNEESGTNYHAETDIHKMKYSKLICLASERMGDFLPGLHGLEEFDLIYNDPESYIDDALGYILSSESEHKYIAVLSMQKLPYKDMLSFYQSLYGLFKSGKITAKELNEYIFVPSDFGMFFEKYYNEREVVAFLHLLLSDPSIPQNYKTEYTEISNGKWEKELKLFREMQHRSNGTND